MALLAGGAVTRESFFESLDIDDRAEKRDGYKSGRGMEGRGRGGDREDGNDDGDERGNLCLH
jgi:hypothetical protein